MRGATKVFSFPNHDKGISTHAPLAGRDFQYRSPPCCRTNFNPRAPCGARRFTLTETGKIKVFQPTRPLRGATCHGRSRRTNIEISTHAPLAGRDLLFPLSLHRTSPFQPTRPLRGATRPLSLIPLSLSIFQPTRPLRGATLGVISASVDEIFQPTRPLRGATSFGRT